MIAACCEQAEARGVAAGMDLTHARSLLHGLPALVEPFTPEEDAGRLEALARWALRFSPVVAPDPPDGLLLDLAGCERLYDSQKRLLEKIARSLARLGFPSRLAIAGTFACARAMARHGQRRLTVVASESLCDVLAPLPISALRLDPAACKALIEVGVETVGSLLALPREELAARFGAEILRRLDQALGIIEERIEPIKPHRCYEATHVFDGPVTAVDIIQAVVRKLVDDVLRELRKHRRGVQWLMVAFRRPQMDPSHASVRLTRPTCNAAHLWSLLVRQLERVNIGYGVEEVHLRMVRTGRLTDEQLTLWCDVDLSHEQRADSAAWGELLDELLARLGARAVARVRAAATYTPERAFQRIGHGDVPVKGGDTIYAACRPSRLFTRPEPVRVITLVPDHPPAWLTWRGQRRRILVGYGPERIALPWWTDPDAPTRDYYVVQDEAGRWLWVFHDLTAGGWFVHGEWA